MGLEFSILIVSVALNRITGENRLRKFIARYGKCQGRVRDFSCGICGGNVVLVPR